MTCWLTRIVCTRPPKTVCGSRSSPPVPTSGAVPEDLSGLRSLTGGRASSSLLESIWWSSPRKLFYRPRGDGGAHDRLAAIGDFDLGGEGQPSHELVTSAEPCAMYLDVIS